MQPITDSEIPNNGPRVTLADIEANIFSVRYINAGEAVAAAGGQALDADRESLGLLTFCILVLKNGFTVTGESACVSRENFDAEVGQKVARANAVQKIWPLLGFLLRDRLYAESLAIETPDPAQGSLV